MKTFTKQNIDFAVFVKLEDTQEDSLNLQLDLEVVVLMNGVKVNFKVPKKILFKVLELKEGDEILVYWKEKENKGPVLDWVELINNHFYN